MAFAYELPETPEAAVAALAGAPAGSVVVLAGGTDLLLDIELGRIAPRRVVSLGKLPWRELERREGRLTLGSLRPLREIEKDPRLPGDLPGFHEAVRAVGSPALRTRATLGGNLGRSAPTSDLLPILLALDATIELYGPGGTRRRPLAEVLGPSRRPGLDAGELVRSVELPERAPSAYVWQRVRPSNDISQVGVAVARPSPDGGWRIALGGVAPVPQRLPEAEAAVGRPDLDDAAIERASERAGATAPFVTDRRATEAYRRLVVRALTGRALRIARDRIRLPEVRP